jgi:hypothetical protein
MSHVPPPRPLSGDDKKRDLMRLLSDGRSLLDPPPSVGATKAPTPKRADPHRIKPQNPPTDRGDVLALRVIADIDQSARAAIGAAADVIGSGRAASGRPLLS